MFNGEKHVHVITYIIIFYIIITYIIIISITSLPHFFLPQKRKYLLCTTKTKKI